LEIDYGGAARFLAALSADNEYTFQTFAEAPGSGRALNRILHGSFDRHARTLAALNFKGAGVFVMVNRGDLKGRASGNVIGARALFVDLDGAPLDPVLNGPLAPRIVVESSPARWHAYWPVVDLPLSYFTNAQKTLALRFQGDPRVSDRPRVMRVPGFLHNKAAPFLSRLETAVDAPLTWSEIAAAFSLQDRIWLPNAIAEGKRNETLFKLAVSARGKGVPEDAQVGKALQVNSARCHPPLAEDEVRELVASAYRLEETRSFPLPVGLLDAAAFKELDDSARFLLVCAYRRTDGFGEGSVTLPWTELSDWFTREKTFYKIRARLLASGLLSIVREPTKRMPRKGQGPEPTVFRLQIPPQRGPYCNRQIPPPSAPPEALQALGFSGSAGLKAVGGREHQAKGRAA
jgi:hypothetical protein